MTSPHHQEIVDRFDEKFVYKPLAEPHETGGTLMRPFEIIGTPYRIKQFILSELSLSHQNLLDTIIGEVEGMKCDVPPEPYGNIKRLTRAFVDKLLLFVGRYNYNKGVKDVLSLLRKHKEENKNN